MAKFCTNCGKELKDGKPCDCQKNVTPEGNLGENLIDAFKGMFTKPVDTIKTYTNDKSFGMSMILVGIMSVLVGLLTMSLLKNFMEVFMDSITSGLYYYSTIDIPYAQGFFIAAIATFALSFIFTGLLYLVNTSMFKGKGSFKEIYSLYGTTSIITSAAVAIATILLFVNGAVAIIVFALGSLLNLVYLIKGLNLIGPKDENKHGYIYTIAITFYLIVMVIIMAIFQ